MLSFIVPVKSARVSADWEKFSSLVERTLRSVCNQKDSDYRVIVACHEKPIVNYQNEKIIYLEAEFPIPDLIDGQKDLNTQKKEHDKSQKIHLGLDKAKELGTDYVMVVDSDDLISNKIAGFVNTSGGTHGGWYVNKGYFFKESSSFMVKNKKTFNQLCGTSIAIKPEYVGQLFDTKENGYLLFKHHIMELDNNVPMDAFPFAAAVYSMMNGENHYFTVDYAISQNKPKSIFSISELKRLFGKVFRYNFVLIHPVLKKEFGLYKVGL